VTARDVLDVLVASGVAVWMENGKLGIYPIQRLTPQLKQALREHRHEIARIIREDYSCWRCGSNRVRYDIPLRRYVCDDCCWVLNDPRDPFPPIAELVLAAGAVYGYPEVKLTPFATLESGREAWLRFCTAPIIGNHLHLLLTAYRKLANPAEAVDIDEPETTTPNTKEENDMKIVWTSTEPIPTGEYRVRVESVTEQKSKFDDTVQLVWKLRVLNSEFEGRELTAWTNATGSTKGKLAKWARACGFDVEPGEAIDTNDLVGRKAVAVVVLKRDDEGNTFNRVEDLLPSPTTFQPATVSAKPNYDPFAEE